MKLVEVDVINFCSIDHINLKLDRPGLTLVLGRNRDEGYESNGASKSATFEAIAWCLFGELLRDQPIDDTVRNGTQAMRVSVIVDPEDGTPVLRVTRARQSRRTTLTVEDLAGTPSFPAPSITDLQRPLNEWLGLDFRTFTNSVFFGTGLAKFFMAAQDAERKDVLDTILQMVSFEDALGRAKERRSSLQERVSHLDQEILLDSAELSSKTQTLKIQKDARVERTKEVELQKSNLRELMTTTANLDSLKVESSQLQAEIRGIESKKKIELDKLQADLASGQTTLAKLYEEKKETTKVELKASLDKSEKEIKDTWATVKKELKEADTLKKDSEGHLRDLESAVRSSEADLKKTKDKRKRYEDSTSGEETCPTCRQPIDAEHLASVLVDYDLEIAEIMVRVKEATRQAQKYEKELEPLYQLIRDLTTQDAWYSEKLDVGQKAYNKSLSDMLEALNEERRNGDNVLFASLKKFSEGVEKKYSNEHTSVSARYTEVEKKIATATQAIKDQKERIKVAVDEEQDLDLAISRTKNDVASLKAKLDTAEKNKDSVKETLTRVEFWVEAFGPRGIRSFVFESALPYLTERANHYSTFLTGGSIMISITPTVTTKTTGNVKEKLNVVATNQIGANVYGGNSSGERRRIDLCILLSLRDLIATRAKRVWNTLIFDEVFENLDGAGTDRVIEMFRTFPSMAIFVISHSAELKRYFDECLVVEKKDGISRLAA